MLKWLQTKPQWNEKKSNLRIKSPEIELHSLINLRHHASHLRLSLFGRQKVRQSLLGLRQSTLRGRGVEFDEVRLYKPGDDSKKIDWRVTARTGKAHTKVFHEEREQNVIVLVDMRSQMFFGTRGTFKSVIAAEIVAYIGWATLLHNDRLGALIFTDNDQLAIRPKRQQQNLLHIFNFLTSVKPNHNKSDESLLHALQRLRHVVKPGNMIFIISDFYGINQEVLMHCAKIANHHELICCFVFDDLEKQPPKANHYAITDNDHWLEIDTSDKAFCQFYKTIFEKRYSLVFDFARKFNVPFLEFATDQSVANVLQKSFGTYSNYPKISYG